MWHRLLVGGAIALLLLPLAPGAASAQRGPLQTCFPETGQCISGRFRDYWEQNGGLAVFGFPVTPVRNEVNRDTGQSYLTQWFERNRFELHLENKPPYDVLLGRLGDDRLRQAGVVWQNLPRAEGAALDCLWFPQTGRNVCDQAGGLGFKTYWSTRGLNDPALDPFGRSLALFGLPLTEPRMETNASGDTVLTQWFERARFEWHPDKPDEFKVLLGLLGSGGGSAGAPGPGEPAGRAGPATGDPCAVADIRPAGQGNGAWSSANNLVVANKRDDAGVSQIYVQQPDGSGARCLSCQARPGAPGVDRNKANPVWRPAGDFFAVQVEMADHPSVQAAGRALGGALITNGLWNNLYMVTADGQRWFQLTDYSPTRRDGALGPVFSADGSKLLWSRMAMPAAGVPAGGSTPFGAWRLYLADVVVDDAGRPRLANERDVTPSGGAWFEANGFSPDGQRLILTADIGLGNAYGMDIWTMNRDASAPTNLTNSPARWDEHASYAPNGRKIAWMSSRPYDFDMRTTLTLRTEIMLMNADGSDVRQLTHFNAPGYPESSPERSIAASSSWSRDGTRLLVGQLMGGLNYPTVNLWLLTFAGACGG